MDRVLSRLMAHLPHPIRAVVWDLDGTLGPLPGWDGRSPVHQYCTDVDALRRTLRWLRRQGVVSVMASRNGMFCELDDLRATPATRQQFVDLGFDLVGGCYAQERGTTKVAAVVRRFGRGAVLLLDDQRHECARAAEQGAYALQLHAPATEALPAGRFTLHAPPQQRRRRASLGRGLRLRRPSLGRVRARRRSSSRARPPYTSRY